MVDGLDGGGGEPSPLPGALPGTIASILGRARVIVTPYPFGVSDADNLRIVSVNSSAGITIEIHGRQAVGGFESKPFRFVHTPNSNRTAKTQDFVLGAGLVTNLSVFAADGTPLIGQTYVIIQLVRSLGSVAYVMGTLLAGYVTSTQGVGWPGSAIESSIEGGGYIRHIIGTQPPAGAQILETCPLGARWQLMTMSASFQVSGAAANRLARFQAFDDIQTLGFGLTNNSMIAGQHWNLAWAPNMPLVWDATSFFGQSAMPRDITLLATNTFGTNVANMQAGDQWSAPVFQVREWLEAT